MFFKTFQHAAAVTCFLFLSILTCAARAQSPTAFTYQGQMTQSGQPFSGTASISFRLYAAPSGGTPLATLPAASIQVQNGLFTAPIDFGSTKFRTGNAGYIEAVVVDAGVETPLSPRQLITPAPLALGVVGMSLVPRPIVDIEQTTGSGMWLFTQYPVCYQSFTAGTSGQLLKVTFLGRGYSDGPIMYATLRSGLGTGGTSLGTAASDLITSEADSPVVLDFASQNILLTAGQIYTIVFAFGGDLATATPVAGTQGLCSSSPANYWFRTVMGGAIVPAVAASSDFASTANSANTATTAATATTADTATSASMLLATGRSGLADQELGLRGAPDLAHGLGWFGGSQSFRNTSFAPDGPVLWGNSGGGLGTSNPAGTAGNIALRWNSSGLVGIGTAPSSSGYRLELPNTASAAGQGRANAWVTYSSRDFKQNIREVDDAMSLLGQLRGVRFDWKQTDDQGNHTHDIGFIAEEVAAVLPELVNHDASGKALGLDYGRIVPVAVEAIKQQAQEIARNRAEIAALKERLDRLEQARSH